MKVRDKIMTKQWRRSKIPCGNLQGPPVRFLYGLLPTVFISSFCYLQYTPTNLKIPMIVYMFQTLKYKLKSSGIEFVVDRKDLN